jgi:hypothetical protein
MLSPESSNPLDVIGNEIHLGRMGQRTVLWPTYPWKKPSNNHEEKKTKLIAHPRLRAGDIVVDPCQKPKLWASRI